LHRHLFQVLVIFIDLDDPAAVTTNMVARARVAITSKAPTQEVQAHMQAQVQGPAT
jgi:hypothetical protein